MSGQGNRGRTVVFICVFISLLILFAYHRDQVTIRRPVTTDASHSSIQPALEHDPSLWPAVEIVVASTQNEDTTWLPRHFPHWKQSIYVVDNASAALTVPVNKGHESMVYLTYLIDNYYQLPDNVLFIHASRFAWHNDDPDYDALPTLRNFQFDYLQEQGYVNLRCVWTIGCPAEIRPYVDEANGQVGNEPSTKEIYKQSFEQLFVGQPVPEVVAVSCCSQFGVSRDVIQRRPREDYIAFRQWLIDTTLDDSRSGRVFEFSWHIIFGRNAVFCPSAEECYCRVFGQCNMTCSDVSCDKYVLPPFANLPQGWPRVGWEGEPREFTGPLP